MIGYFVDNECDCHGWLWWTRHYVLSDTIYMGTLALLVAIGILYLTREFIKVLHEGR